MFFRKKKDLERELENFKGVTKRALREVQTPDLKVLDEVSWSESPNAEFVVVSVNERFGDNGWEFTYGISQPGGSGYVFKEIRPVFLQKKQN